MKTRYLPISLIAAAGAAGTAQAAEILVTTDIAVSTTWTANNTYNLQQQIYVLPGATLTIEAGVVVASDTNIGGSLAVTRGAQIFIQFSDWERDVAIAASHDLLHDAAAKQPAIRKKRVQPVCILKHSVLSGKPSRECVARLHDDRIGHLLCNLRELRR